MKIRPIEENTCDAVRVYKGNEKEVQLACTKYGFEVAYYPYSDIAWLTYDGLHKLQVTISDHDWLLFDEVDGSVAALKDDYVCANYCLVDGTAIAPLPPSEFNSWGKLC